MFWDVFGVFWGKNRKVFFFHRIFFFFGKRKFLERGCFGGKHNVFYVFLRAKKVKKRSKRAVLRAKSHGKLW